MIEELIAEIKKYTEVSSELSKKLKHSFIVRKIKKNEILVNYGSVCYKTFFVVNGSFKSTTYTQEGEAKIIWFYFDDLFRIISIKDAFLTKGPTKYEITALEDSTILDFDMEVVNSLIINYPDFNKFFRFSSVTDFTLSEEIRIHLLCYSKEDFVTYLYKNFPTIPLRAPSHAIADFMGITREWYSKIKKKKSNI